MPTWERWDHLVAQVSVVQFFPRSCMSMSIFYNYGHILGLLHGQPNRRLRAYLAFVSVAAMIIEACFVLFIRYVAVPHYRRVWRALHCNSTECPDWDRLLQAGCILEDFLLAWFRTAQWLVSRPPPPGKVKYV